MRGVRRVENRWPAALGIEMKRLRKLLTTLVILSTPNFLKVRLLDLLGHHVSTKSKIGLCFIRAESIYLAAGACIGHFNLIDCRRLVLLEGAYIESLNLIRGPISVWMASRAGIGKRNNIKRSAKPVTYGPAVLRLGVLTKITLGHLLDCTRSIRFGNFTTVAGVGSQFWTHGYFHASLGPDRFRVDGDIVVGNNVSIGSACVFSAGVQVADAIQVGSHSSVAKSLDKPGIYVSQSLRYIPANLAEIEARLERVDPALVCERVYRKAGR
jgi:acetyltransferase-like isoleucine patch superfamily enzyme